MLEAGQAVQPQIQNSLGLSRGEMILALANAEFLRQIIGPAGVGTRPLQHGHDVTGRPGSGHQSFPRVCRRR